MTEPKRVPFPRPTSDFRTALPHRPPFVWIDEVTEVNPDGGTCAVTLQENAAYFGPEDFRRSSALEFMAQGFGYLRAAQVEAGLLPGRPAPKKAFLVSIQDAIFSEIADLQLAPGTRLAIEITGVREIGPITLFSATVRREGAPSALVQARLKIYSE